MKAFTLFRRCLGAFLLIMLLPAAKAQEDDFNDGNDTGWTRFTPLGNLAAATFNVTGGIYNLACTPSTNTAAGPSRCAALRQEISYGTFCTMVDIVNFNASEETSMGIIARIQPGPSLGTVKAYTFTYQSESGDVEINRTTNETPTNLSGTIKVSLQPGTAYRMIFFGLGSRLEGRIYEKSNFSTPLVTAIATDTTYASGTAGVFIFSNGNTRCSASFDNYSANNGTSPPLSIATDGSGLTLSWDAARGLGHILEASDTMDLWSAVADPVLADGSAYYSEAIQEGKPSRFFRLRLGE